MYPSLLKSAARFSHDQDRLGLCNGGNYICKRFQTIIFHKFILEIMVLIKSASKSPSLSKSSAVAQERELCLHANISLGAFSSKYATTIIEYICIVVLMGRLVKNHLYIVRYVSWSPSLSYLSNCGMVTGASIVDKGFDLRSIFHYGEGDLNLHRDKQMRNLHHCLYHKMLSVVKDELRMHFRYKTVPSSFAIKRHVAHY
jgi:hypothetical protein